jgi:hypothetical protein
MKKKLRDNWPPYEDVRIHVEQQQAVLDAKLREATEELERARRDAYQREYERGVREYWAQRAMEEQAREERRSPWIGAMTLFGWLVFWRAMFKMGGKK